MEKTDKKLIYVAMSGGVDSSVAALLLKRQGYDVIGVFMKLFSKTKETEAKKVCKKLNIPFLIWDFKKEFKKIVIDNFIKEYKKGNTPNPCVVCNPEIKFGLFLKKALKSGAFSCRQTEIYIATGHYVKLQKLKNKNIYQLFQAKDKNKDQSYFLWKLNQEQLKHCIFPLGDFTKEEIKKIAKENKLIPDFKKESQEICFVKDVNTIEFLKKWIKPKKGNIINFKNKEKIGEHQGARFYTIGQRAPVGGTGPYYIIKKDLKRNELLVIKKNDKEFSFPKIKLKNINWVAGKAPKSRKILARTRYKEILIPAKFIVYKSSFFIQFDKPVRFIASGQSAVFYNKNKKLLGGGIII
ncbi:tRNA 2-thiouridine(34) synthase MnmA [Candidatus Wolfebacteria bacterium]|nr:tRNA 2-thiouridine(34) synthase MnmA [Candidatus Wolfebacteria bacterium]